MGCPFDQSRSMVVPRKAVVRQGKGSDAFPDDAWQQGDLHHCHGADQQNEFEDQEKRVCECRPEEQWHPDRDASKVVGPPKHAWARELALEKDHVSESELEQPQPTARVAGSVEMHLARGSSMGAAQQ